MSDLIDRQAAIDSIEKHLRFGDELYPLTETDKILNHAFEIAVSCVYNLPCAQPEESTECLIDRHAAIALAKDICVPTKDGTVYRHRCIDPDAIKELPTAQPERKKGEWTATYSDCGGDVWVSWKCSNCGYVRKKG